MGKTQQSLFEIMVDFMERNSDIKWTGCIGPNERLETLKKWHELVDLLNSNASKGSAKSLHKWRKAWSDLKNNTRKKVERIRRLGSSRASITSLEKRVLTIIGNNENDNTAVEEDGIQFKIEVDPDVHRHSSPQPECNFVSVEEHDQESQDRRHSTSSTTFSSASSSESAECVRPRKKRKRTEVTPDSVKEITDRFFEFEREREIMAHEQEMARLKQNEKLLSIVGRMVNVLETLAPNIQKYLNQDIMRDEEII